MTCASFDESLNTRQRYTRKLCLHAELWSGRAGAAPEFLDCCPVKRSEVSSCAPAALARASLCCMVCREHPRVSTCGPQRAAVLATVLFCFTPVLQRCRGHLPRQPLSPQWLEGWPCTEPAAAQIGRANLCAVTGVLRLCTLSHTHTLHVAPRCSAAVAQQP